MTTGHFGVLVLLCVAFVAIDTSAPPAAHEVSVATLAIATIATTATRLILTVITPDTTRKTGYSVSFDTKLLGACHEEDDQRTAYCASARVRMPGRLLLRYAMPG
jgi:hypothetical protein